MGCDTRKNDGVFSFAPIRLPLRAEELSPNEVAEISSKSPVIYAARSLADRLRHADPLLNPTVLVGPKGSGKTLAAIAAALSLSKPIRYYVYRDSRRVEDISGRLGLGGEPQAYIFDDIHYICEAVAGGLEDVKLLEDFVSEALSLAEEGFPVVLVSEDPPHMYFEDLGVRPLASCSERFTKLHLLFVEPLGFGDWVEIVRLYGIRGDEPGLSLAYALSPRPRFFLKLASEVGDLTLENIVRGAAERLSARGCGLSLLNGAVLPIPPSHLKRVSKILGEVKLIEENRSLFKAVAGLVASELRRMVKNPFAFGTHHFNRWNYDDAFVIKAYSKRFGFPWGQVYAAVASLFPSGDASRLTAAFRDYIKYDYEEIRDSALRAISKVESMRGFIKLTGTYVFKPRAFLEAFSDLLETPTIELVREAVKRLRLNEKWASLFRHFREVKPDFSPEDLIRLRRAFLKNAANGLKGNWKKKIMAEALGSKKDPKGNTQMRHL